MATTGLEVFDRTLHTTNLWLDEISAEIGPDRHLAWHVLGAVLRSIRDEMLVEQSAHFAAQLPLLVRGAYFDQYRPAAQPASDRSQGEFIARIQRDLHGARPVNAEQAVSAVTRTLNRHVTEGQVKKVRDSLPKGVRVMWPEPGHDRGAGQQKSDQGEKSGQSAQGGAEPASGDQRQPQQHAAAPPPAPSQQAAPPRPEPQHTEPPRPTMPQHSTSQQSLCRPAQDERVEMFGDTEEETPSVGTPSSRSSSGKSPHMPIGPSSRPPAVQAAPSTDAPSTETATGARKTKTRTKRSTDND